MSLESLNDISKKRGRGGARPGAGRPKGTVEAYTLERMAIKQAFIDRVHLNADKLFNAQLNKAIGETYLMWRHKVGSGANAKTVTEVVDDPEILKQYLDDTLDMDGDWYYLSTKPSDNLAIQNLVDRAFGKATEKVQLGNDPDNPLPGEMSAEAAAKYAEYLKSRE